MSRVLIIGWDGADWRILDPLLERGALPNLRALIDRGGRGRPALDHPHPLVDRLAVLPHRRGPGRPRRLRHPRDAPGREAAVPRDLPVDPGADVPARPRPRRVTETVMVNVPLTFPPPGHLREARSPAACCPSGRPFTHPESLAATWRAAGRPVADQRDVLDHVPEPPRAVPGRGRAGDARPGSAATEHLLDTTDWRVAVRGVRRHRPDPALPERVPVPRPPGVRRALEGRAGRRRCATSTGCWTTGWARWSTGPAPTTWSCS